MAWQVKVSLKAPPGGSGGAGAADAALSASIWDPGLAAACSGGAFGVSVEAQSLLLSLESAPKGPCRIRSRIEGVSKHRVLWRVMWGRYPAGGLP